MFVKDYKIYKKLVKNDFKGRNWFPSYKPKSTFYPYV